MRVILPQRSDLIGTGLELAFCCTPRRLLFAKFSLSLRSWYEAAGLQRCLDTSLWSSLSERIKQRLETLLLWDVMLLSPLKIWENVYIHSWGRSELVGVRCDCEVRCLLVVVSEFFSQGCCVWDCSRDYKREVKQSRWLKEKYGRICIHGGELSLFDKRQNFTRMCDMETALNMCYFKPAHSFL